MTFDSLGRPRLCLAAGHDAPGHDIILETLRPVVSGYCATCHHVWRRSHAAERKARSCPVLVAYLSEVNRDRSMATELRAAVERSGAG